MSRRCTILTTRILREVFIQRLQLRYVAEQAPVQPKVGVVVPTGFEPVFKP